MIRRNLALLFTIACCVCTHALSAHAESQLLTPQENLWLRSRNNTIVVYPEKNNPPFSYQSASGVIEGLSVDYIELIAENIGATVQYLAPRSRVQIVDEAATGKGDVILTLAATAEAEQKYVFTNSYVTVPFVIVVRKDIQSRASSSLADYLGKRVALTAGSVIEGYVRQNYPRIVIEDVTDNEAALQQVVLGQVEAAVMDVASLSYLLSKQVLSSVKVVGNVGFDFTPSFAMTKDKQVLQTILEKGMTQISPQEKEALTEKWISLPAKEESRGLLEHLQSSTGMFILYVFFVVVLIGLIMILMHRRKKRWSQFRKDSTIQELHDELNELEAANKTLSEEIEEVKHLEETIEEKLKRLNE
jgi:ABC-type amino acid transport substrate-binding protein/cell division protein FtsB